VLLEEALEKSSVETARPLLEKSVRALLQQSELRRKTGDHLRPTSPP
jgi:hypothetical protein